MNRIILANLKAYKTPKQVAEWCDAFLSAFRGAPEEAEVVLALPDMALERAAETLRGKPGIALAAQCVSPFPMGGYTGSTPAAWLRELVRYTLAGHRERRTYFRETPQDVVRQAAEALEEGIVPIVCVDRGCFMPQLGAFQDEERGELCWAFTTKAEVPLRMPEDLAAIKDSITKIARQTDMRPVLYGGGVNADNARAIWSIEGLAGIMLGDASHDPEKFARIVASLG